MSRLDRQNRCITTILFCYIQKTEMKEEELAKSISKFLIENRIRNLTDAGKLLIKTEIGKNCLLWL